MKNRYLALLLCILMVCGMVLPTSASNEEGDGGADTTTNTDNNGLELDKYISEDGKNLVLEAYTTGTVISSGETKPSDIILVLDVSNSMEKMVGSYSSGTNDHMQFGLHYDDDTIGAIADYVDGRLGRAQGNYELTNDVVDGNGQYNSKWYFYYDEEASCYRRVYWCVTCWNPKTDADYAWVDEQCETCIGYVVNQAETSGKEPDTSKYTEQVDGKYRCSCYEWSTIPHHNHAEGENVADQCEKILAKTSPTDTTEGRIQVYMEADRLAVMKTVVEKFIDNVATQATDDRIALVTFSDHVFNTPAFKSATDGSLITEVRGIRIPEADIVDNEDGTYTYFNVDTEHNIGLEKAKAVMDTLPDSDRNQVVILLTDGVPTDGNYFNSVYWPSNVVGKTIEAAHNLKQDGVDLYAVSIYENSDAENLTYSIDKFLTAVSSNHPDAIWVGPTDESVAAGTDTHYYDNATFYDDQGAALPLADIAYFGDVENPGTAVGGKYYLASADSSNLDAIFEQVIQSIGSSNIDLDKTTITKDIMTEYFVMPGEDEITVKTYDCEGYDEATGEYKWAADADVLKHGEDVTVEIEGDTVNVDGFDFGSNYVTKVPHPGTEDFYGKKLVVTIPLELKDDLDILGGNVPTNGSSSGIYDGTEEIENFPMPTYDLPVKQIIPEVKDQHIYLTNEADLTQLMDGFDSRIDGTKNAGVTITYSIKDGDTVIGTLTIEPGKKPADSQWIAAEGQDLTPAVANDKPYTIECVVADAKGNTAEGTATATVYVYTPTVTYKDSNVMYGEEFEGGYAYVDNNLVSVQWKHATQTAVPMGTAPSLMYTYDKNITKIDTKEDIPVNVTAVNVGATNITDRTIFAHKDCDPACDFSSATEEFLLHVANCELTVSKVGGAEDEPYVIDVYKDGKFYTQLTIVGNGSVTIKELPTGTYTIQEDENWAWRYTVNNGSAVQLSKDNTNGMITCTNSERTNTWLSGFSAVVENIYGAALANQ